MFSIFQKNPSISTSELSKCLANGIKLIDVRTAQEYRGGHIAQAKNVPLDRIERYQGKAKEVYVICQSGMRSKQAVQILQKKGYEAINVRGGMNQWTGNVRGGK